MLALPENMKTTQTTAEQRRAAWIGSLGRNDEVKVVLPGPHAIRKISYAKVTRVDKKRGLLVDGFWYDSNGDEKTSKHRRSHLAPVLGSGDFPGHPTHIVEESDRERVRCNDCGEPALIGVHMHWNTGNTEGVSFFYHCAACAKLRGMLITEAR